MPSVPPVARLDELDQIQTWLASEDEGALLVSGDAGIGKTTLVDATLSTVETMPTGPWGTVRVSGSEAEASIPFAGIHQLVYALEHAIQDLDERSRSLIQWFEAPTAEGTPTTVTALATAVLQLLDAASVERRLLIVLEDGHWLDPQSAEVFTFVGRRLTSGRTRLIVAVRTGHSTAFETASFRELALAPLSPDDAWSLLAERRPALTAEAAAHVLELADGNPLALVELPDLTSHRHDTITAPTTISLPARLQRVFGARLDELDAPARSELLRAALDGEGRRPYPLPGGGAAADLGLVQADGFATVRFRHPLVRAAIVERATPNERRAAHAALAEWHRYDLERRARHLAAATVDPDEEVADLLERAARLASRRGAAAPATDLFTRAAELSEDPVRRSGRVAEAAFVAGQAALLDRAQELLDASGEDPRDPAAVITASYLALYRYGDVRSTHPKVLAALEAADPEDAATVERLANLLLAISQFAADPVRWSKTDEAIDRLEAHLPARTLLYRDTWGNLLVRGGGAMERIRASFPDPSSEEPWDVMRLGVAAHYVDLLQELREPLTRMVERETESGAATNLMTMLQLLVLDHFAAGDWDDALMFAERGLELTRQHGYELFEYQFQVFIGLIAAYRGDVEQARSVQETVEAWARPRGIGFLTGYTEAIGVAIAESQGDEETAYALATGISRPGELPAYSHQALRTLLDLVETATHTGRSAEARRHAEAARDKGLPRISERLELLTAGALAMTADADDTTEAFEGALALGAVDRFPFDAARIRLAYGIQLRRLHQPGRAREVLAMATRTFEALGAATWLDRANRELRVGTQRAGMNALTAQERQIAELAASGLSNKEIGAQLFLSPRTVGAHLYRIFPKLGIASRASLRDALSPEG